MKIRFSTLATAAFLAVIVPLHAKVSPQTLDNLNTAFQGESNAAHRYAAYARQAESEGAAPVARLFRAAARAEAIHRDSHRAVILALGGNVSDFKLDAVKAGTTADNLQAAIEGESYERDTMYPDFLKVARADQAKEAVRTLIYAQKAEAEHARLYQEALANLGHNADTPLYVCKVCGNTTTEAPSSRCPSCREPARNYEEIS